MIEHTEEITEAVRRLVDYAWDDERADYAEALARGEDVEGHIFTYINRLAVAFDIYEDEIVYIERELAQEDA